MCTCATQQRHLKANLLAGEAKRTTRPTLVVPVIMARADVVMNGGIIPIEEMVPYAWNGCAERAQGCRGTPQLDPAPGGKKSRSRAASLQFWLRRISPGCLLLLRSLDSSSACTGESHMQAG
jgi:hypothetical protein